MAEIMGGAFLINVEALVNKDYLDARLDALEAHMEAKFNTIYWMMGMGFTVLVIPQLQAWFS